MRYLPRTIDQLLSDYIHAFGAVLIEGPKWCGKTTTAEQQAKSVLKLQDKRTNSETLATAHVRPGLLLDGETPRLIDEWQDAPELWDAIRVTVDDRRKPGQFILTGSNVVDKTKIAHSGTGRIAKLRMLPMSLWESKDVPGGISISALFNQPDLDIDGIRSEIGIERLIFLACRGGWPAIVNLSSEASQLLVAKNFVRSVCSEDISRIDGRSRSEKLTSLILRSYARNISTLAKKTQILADVTSSGESSCTWLTVDNYIQQLEKLFIIRDVDAWNPSIRSQTAIRSQSKRSFCDPSIAAAALGLSPESLKAQLKTFGFLFEQMCIRDLRALTLSKWGTVSYYRDRYGLEADAVLHLEDGRYALIECKLGGVYVNEGAEHLLKIRDLVREANKKERQVPIREPDLLIVLTGGDMAYTRKDGVKVIPLACLEP